MKTTPVPPAAGGITAEQRSLYPPRIRQCPTFILGHVDEICAYPTGTLELHWHEKSVTATHTQRWLRPS